MTERTYAIYDVFTDEALAGNPLAVVFDSAGLDTSDMQKIASEFNLSETAFVLSADNEVHSAKLRIFTPVREMQFAGHPTVGAAVALCEKSGPLGDVARVVTLEEQIGLVRCAVHGGVTTYAEFDLPVLPEPVAAAMDTADAAAVLGLDKHDVVFENHQPMAWSAGNAIMFIPVHGLDTMGRLSFDPVLWRRLVLPINGSPVSVYVYCRDTILHDSAFHARMFSANAGGREDPATGSAVAAFAGMIQQFDNLADGPNEFWIEQGMEMGRPSRIRLEITAKNNKINSARIGGYAVKAAEGKLFV